MKGTVDYKLVLDAAQHEHYCDVGHYYCPTLRADGALIFPSGIVRPDGTFSGARALYDLLCRPVEPGLNLFCDGGAEEVGRYHYPRGTPCPVSVLPERPCDAPRAAAEAG